MNKERISIGHAFEIIKNWSYRDIEGLMKTVVAFWRADRAEETRSGLWVFSTGGLYENEVLLRALKSNPAWDVLFWDSLELPGGFLVVATTKSAKRELERMKERIVKWAWKERQKRRKTSVNIRQMEVSE